MPVSGPLPQPRTTLRLLEQLTDAALLLRLVLRKHWEEDCLDLCLTFTDM